MVWNRIKRFFLKLIVVNVTLGFLVLNSRPAFAASLLSTRAVKNIGENASLAPMLEKVLPAVVNIRVFGVKTQDNRISDEFGNFLDPYFSSFRKEKKENPFEGLGSGVVIDSRKGYILTNNHVVDCANDIQIEFVDGKEVDAKLVGKDFQTDIALLQIKNLNDLTLKRLNLVQAKIADSDKLKVGDFVVAVGNPFGLGQTATLGIISALGRSGLNLDGFENFIQTDASINRGNSGGALVNLNGELVGINTAILAPGGVNIGIGFAVPSNMAKFLSDQIIKYGEIKRGVLGIKGAEMSFALSRALDVDIQKGAFVSEVIPNSAASKSGIRPGDILISINGNYIRSFSELKAKIGTSEVGKKIIIGLLRKGNPLNVSVFLEDDSSKKIKAEVLTTSLLGAILSDGVLKGIKGVKVDSVSEDSPAALVGLKKDDFLISVNEKRIESISQFRKLVRNKPSTLALNILRGDQNIYLLLKTDDLFR